MIISKTPFRISFFGGGTDYDKWYIKNGGEVISTSIDKYCYIHTRYLPPFFDYNIRVTWSKIELCNKINQINHPVVREVLKYLPFDVSGLEIYHYGDLPARSGIGSSSSFTVGLLNAIYNLNRIKKTKKTISS
jgi:D-glycero-alpha-D-manno-heptose-7-phosphate kinase